MASDETVKNLGSFHDQLSREIDEAVAKMAEATKGQPFVDYLPVAGATTPKFKSIKIGNCVIGRSPMTLAEMERAEEEMLKRFDAYAGRVQDTTEWHDDEVHTAKRNISTAREQLDAAKRAEAAKALVARYTQAQRENSEGYALGVLSMRHDDKQAASLEWSRQLREKVEASKRAEAERERNRVVVDWGDLDE